jgi:hypothetical protein
MKYLRGDGAKLETDLTYLHSVLVEIMYTNGSLNMSSTVKMESKHHKFFPEFPVYFL